MAAATPSQLESLRKALSFDRSPLCSGAISPPPEGFHLWYNQKNPRFIDFASATPEDLDLLTEACDPATFGRGNEDVYDESYRKALKMDASNFAVRLDLAGSDLIRTIEDQFFHGETEEKRIKAELYKLNVYDQGSFFKAHKDTPRGTDMIGSLVIIYPPAYEGGELVLRHKDHEWKFDAKLLTVSRPPPSLAYVAFYSDIEHEVLKVTSGRRITVTYNLYLANQTPKPGASAVTPNSIGSPNLQSTLQGLLKSPEFLPNGGTLGFGLVHLYPVTSEMKLREMTSYLKGEDAHVYQACRALQLRPLLRMIYEDELNGPRYGIMVDHIVKGLDYDYECDSYEDTLIEKEGGLVVNKTDRDGLEDCLRVGDQGYDYKLITWISPFSERNRLQDVALAYGNEVSAGCIYSSPCIIVPVRPACDRVRRF